MRFLRIFRQSVKAILRHKGRSFLTSLGIIIGVASVISLVALGQGAQDGITESLSKLGTKTLTIRSGAAVNTGPGVGGEEEHGARRFESSLKPAATKSSLTLADLESIKAGRDDLLLDRVAGFVSDSAQLPLYEKSGTGQIQTQDFTVIGTEPDYFDIQTLALADGRTFTSEELATAASVLVIGSEAATNLFGGDVASGRTLMLNQQPYTVIGVLEAKEEGSLNSPNSQLIGPQTSIAGTYGLVNYSAIYATAVDDTSVDAAKASVEALLESNHGKTADTRDFNVVSQKDILKTVEGMTNTFKALLGGIAGISLIVGGIGIMNIMLVAVTERTREIGLRKAVGARTRHILTQFLLESVMLCLMGGFIGVVLGGMLSMAMGKMPLFGDANIVPSVSIGSIVLAVSVSFIVGVVFGTYPAVKASKLNPIDALRYE